MRKIEEFLIIASDSNKMPGWNDGLSYIIGKESSNVQQLSDEELDMVAGGLVIAREKFREKFPQE